MAIVLRMVEEFVQCRKRFPIVHEELMRNIFELGTVILGNIKR